MTRSLSLYLKRWSIDRWTRSRADSADPSQPRVLVRSAADGQRIIQACERCERRGVHPGMTLAQARAMLTASQARTLAVREHDPVRDRVGLERLAQWANRFSPRVAVDAPDGLHIDATGCERLYHGEQNMLRQLLDAVRKLGFNAAGAIAPTFGCAWALARYSHDDHAIVADLSDIPAALADLPTAALRLDEPTVDALDQVGVRHIGQLMDLPRHQLPGRFSDDLLLRLDQALGRAIETMDPVPFAAPVEVSRTFAGPVKDAQAMQLVGRDLVEKLSQRLAQAESGVRQLRLTLQRYEADPLHLTCALSFPTRDVSHLWSLLRGQVEEANLGHGVETMVLRATVCARLPHEQVADALLNPDADHLRAQAQHAGRLIDALVHRLGPDRVLRMEPTASHLPERVVRLVPADAPPTKANSTATHGNRPKGAMRPTQLLDPPRRIQVQAVSPDGPVLNIRWDGHVFDVQDCVGPERLTHEWWQESTGTRNYFRIRFASGLLAWVYHESPTHHWYLHGWWS